jgi:hypothetical protein
VEPFVQLNYDHGLHSTLPRRTRRLIKAGNCFENEEYVVVKRNIRPCAKTGPELIHLSIKRKDGHQARSWIDLQFIKNCLVGPETEGVELFPAESRKVDFANQYHLWVIKDTKYRFPLGFIEKDDQISE